MPPRLRIIPAFALIFVSLSCGGGDSPTPPTPPAKVLTSVAVTVSPASVQVGQSATASATGADQNGAAMTLGAIVWSSSNTTVATISATGVISAASPGTAQIVATTGGKSGQAAFTVTAPPNGTVATVRVTPLVANVAAGSTTQLSAQTLDANGNTMTGRAIEWASSDITKATVNASGLVTGVAAGTATITATSEARVGSAAVTITPPPPPCASANAVTLNPGEARAFTSTDAAAMCLGGIAAASEYVLIPFNNSPVPSATTQFQLDATNTISVQTVPNLGVIDAGQLAIERGVPDYRRVEAQFRIREAQDIGTLRSRQRVTRSSAIPSDIAVGSIVQLNSNVSGNTCTAPRINHPARLVALLPRTMVFIDTLSPPGGYSDAELIAFAQGFDTLAYAIDTLNFGAVTDIDGNNRVAIFFTPGINSIPGPAGGFVGGLFAARDLFSTAPQSGCVGSNEGEMFYMPVPDPNSTINGNYTNKTNISRIAVSTLAHELQHLINASRRIYVNNASSFEVIWLNEALSHIAEELMYYASSGNRPQSNLTLQAVASSQALVDAFNANSVQNFGRLRSYFAATASSSPFSSTDGLEMRGAAWQLLRYASDQKGGDERQTWLALTNSATSGQSNFSAVFGDLVTKTRDWTVAQFVDDMGLNVAAKYTNPSWNFRSILPALSGNQFPLATSHLIGGTPLSLQLVGGGTAYVRFRLAATTFGTIVASASGQPLPANVDFVLVRTQ